MGSVRANKNVRRLACFAAGFVLLSACSSSSSSSGAPKNISKPSIQVSSPTTFTVLGMNHKGEDLVGCDEGPLPPSSNVAKGYGEFLQPNPNRMLVCGYRGKTGSRLLFDRGSRVASPAAIVSSLDGAPARRSATGALTALCPPNGLDGIVLSVGYSYRLTTTVFISSSGCAYELNNNTTIMVPAATLALLRRTLGYTS